MSYRKCRNNINNGGTCYIYGNFTIWKQKTVNFNKSAYSAYFGYWIPQILCTICVEPLYYILIIMMTVVFLLFLCKNTY